MTDPLKTCVKCNLEKPLSDFYRQAGMRDGYRNDCKDCMARYRKERYRKDPQRVIERVQQWRRDNPEKYLAWRKRYLAENNEQRREANRRGHLRRKYGLSIEVYEFLCLVQSNGCAICGEDDEKLHVDHEHGTGRVRGLLCGKCNKAIGLLNDDPQLLAAAARYLQKRQLPLGCGDSTPIKRRHRPASRRDGIS